MHCNAPEKQTEIRIFRKLFLCIPNLGMIHATRIKTQMHRESVERFLYRAIHLRPLSINLKYKCQSTRCQSTI